MGLANFSEVRKKELVEAFYKTTFAEGLENTSFAKIGKSLNIQPSLEDFSWWVGGNLDSKNESAYKDCKIVGKLPTNG